MCTLLISLWLKPDIISNNEDCSFILLHLACDQSMYMWGEVNCFTPLFNLINLYMAVSFLSWRKSLFLGVNKQPSVSNWQLPLMGFEPEQQRRGASSLKSRRLSHSAMAWPRNTSVTTMHLHRKGRAIFLLPIVLHVLDWYPPVALRYAPREPETSR